MFRDGVLALEAATALPITLLTICNSGASVPRWYGSADQLDSVTGSASQLDSANTGTILKIILWLAEVNESF